jgi:hypothetical protein
MHLLPSPLPHRHSMHMPCLVSSASFFPSLPLPYIYSARAGQQIDRTRARPRLPGSLRPVRCARTPQQGPRSSSTSLHSMSRYSKTLFSIYTPSVLNYRKPLFILLAPCNTFSFLREGEKKTYVTIGILLLYPGPHLEDHVFYPLN